MNFVFLAVKNQVLKNSDSYTAVRLLEANGQKKLYWVWGKTDFISFFRLARDIWRCYKIMLVKKQKLYEFIETSGHGTMFDETKWVSDDDIIYIELPKNFANLMFVISNQLLTSISKS